MIGLSTAAHGMMLMAWTPRKSSGALRTVDWPRAPRRDWTQNHRGSLLQSSNSLRVPGWLVARRRPLLRAPAHRPVGGRDVRVSLKLALDAMFVWTVPPRSGCSQHQSGRSPWAGPSVENPSVLRRAADRQKVVRRSTACTMDCGLPASRLNLKNVFGESENMTALLNVTPGEYTDLMRALAQRAPNGLLYGSPIGLTGVTAAGHAKFVPDMPSNGDCTITLSVTGAEEMASPTAEGGH